MMTEGPFVTVLVNHWDDHLSYPAPNEAARQISEDINLGATVN
jgi:hypothetical protein